MLLYYHGHMLVNRFFLQHAISVFVFNFLIFAKYHKFSIDKSSRITL